MRQVFRNRARHGSSQHARASRLGLVVGTAIVLLGGCNAPGASDAGPSAAVAACSTSSERADAAWRRLSDVAPLPEMEADAFAPRVLAHNETALQRYREEGLVFWRSFPEDCRRYQWLMMTTHLAPHYPEDITLWADEELRLAPNSAAVDAEALSQWRGVYVDLRDAFLQSPDVSVQDKRFLALGEAHTEIDHSIRARARGEAVSLNDVLAPVIDFARRFDGPTSPEDEDDYDAALRTLVYAVEDRLPMLQASANDYMGFLEALKETSAYIARKPNMFERGWVLPFDDTVDPRWRFVTAASLFMTNAGHPTNMDFIISAVDARIVRLKYRELGAREWAVMPEVVKRSWYNRALSISPDVYRRDFVRLDPDADYGAYSRGSGALFNRPSRDRWDRLYAQYEEEMWGLIADESRALQSVFRGAEVRQDLWAAAVDYRLTGSNTHTLAALDALLAFYEDFGPSRMFRSLSIGVVRDPGAYGLSNDEVYAFALALVDNDDPRVRNLARGIERRRALEIEGFAFAAPTLEGEAFALSQLRGDIVLLQFWSTSCASCIAAKPRLHDIYLEYRDAGFEVVSISADADRERLRVQQIRSRMGLTWTTLNAEAQWEQINAEMGWGGVLPHYLLLDRDGRLVADTEDLDYGRNLPSLLDDMLAVSSR